MISETDRRGIIEAAFYHLGALAAGETVCVSDFRYADRELEGILATLHLALAQRLARQYGVTLAAPTNTSTVPASAAKDLGEILQA